MNDIIWDCEACSLFGWRPRPVIGIEPLDKAIRSVK